MKRRVVAGASVAVAMLGVFLILSISRGGFPEFDALFENPELLTENRDHAEYELLTIHREEHKHIRFFQGFNGVETIFELEADHIGFVSVNALGSLRDGDYKVVVVMPDGKVHVLMENDQRSEAVVALKEGVSKLKFVGLDAKGTLSLEVEVHGGS